MSGTTATYGSPMQPSRALAAALEPVTGQVYFSPECHANYVALGFADSRGQANGVALPDGPAYFTSRGSLMGQVPGELVAAAFAVFNPETVVPSVSLGWTLTDAATICAARDDGATRAAASHPRRRARRRRPGEGDPRPSSRHRCVPKAARCTPGCCRRRFPPTTSAPSGAWATCCVSSAAIRTPQRGSAPESTPPRSVCSASCTGDCRCAATAVPGPGPTRSSTPRTSV